MKQYRRLQIIGGISFAAVLITIVLNVKGGISIESFIAGASGNIVLSAFLLILLFGLKSLTVIVPWASLCVASGILFRPLPAVLISFAGMALVFTCPFLSGRWAGTEALKDIRRKYPKFDRIIELQKKNSIFAVFMVRLIGWLPCDAVSFYFGACGLNYPLYLLISLAGSAFGIITNTLLGDVILHPFTVRFAVLMLVKVLVSLSAAGAAYLLRPKPSGNDPGSERKKR